MGADTGGKDHVQRLSAMPFSLAHLDVRTQLGQVVAGRLVNGYSTQDWVLPLLCRALHFHSQVAGTRAVEVAGVENRDLTSIVPGHLRYRQEMPIILQVGPCSNVRPCISNHVHIFMPNRCCASEFLSIATKQIS